VRAEVIDRADPLASTHGLGALGIMEVAPTPAQTAYGVLADLIDIRRCVTIGK